MKSRITRILSIGFALAAVAAVHAQEKTVVANVPFSFYMGSSPMPQGAYRVDEFSRGSLVCMRSAHANTSVFTSGIESKKAVEPARLVFHRYGDVYFLAQIWNGDGAIGRAIPASAREKELAQNGTAPSLAMIQLAVR
jgi:hypothetical protein